MNTQTDKKVKKYLLRLDKELMDKVRQAAENNRRSINSQLCMIVEDWAKGAFSASGDEEE